MHSLNMMEQHSNTSIQPKVEPDTKLDGVAIVANDIGESPGIEHKQLGRVISYSFC
ncbi:hypothetical protein [Alkalihalobacillus sp. BA299]|uniref:hypothetical protein n=1 Tax=Alkalihalobacillus sp. BA299 TaxID=2815938 RepID=UPI001AD9F823|nr:hypothetical protein [Alkalihalobacillus sp. BA299]